MKVPVKRSGKIFSHDSSRVIARFAMPHDKQRAVLIIRDVLELPPEEVRATLNTILKNFSQRHRNITLQFKKNYYNMVKHIHIPMDKDIDESRILLIGAYFTREYSIEAAAFFNPSIVLDPDQDDLEDGETRVIVSFRATGEGHISSIVFRNGIIDKRNDLRLVEMNTFVDEYKMMHRTMYHREVFLQKLSEMGISEDVLAYIVEYLPEDFKYDQLQGCIDRCRTHTQLSHTIEIAIDELLWLADAYYTISFSYDTALSERVLYPISKQEVNGIEDARFVRFTDEDGSVRYYATFTAYDGKNILSKLLETKDFYHFQVRPLLGQATKNKGIALFPRKIGGSYCALSRMDGHHNYVMFSDSIHRWEQAVRLESKLYPWEMIHSGNCGSPIEIDEGWLVITHGVGAMRKYSIGAMLLDKEDPSKILGRTTEPLIRPNEQERNGYVPNVLYSCGSIVIGRTLILPYGISDATSSYATVSLDDLLSALS